MVNRLFHWKSRGEHAPTFANLPRFVFVLLFVGVVGVVVAQEVERIPFAQETGTLSLESRLDAFWLQGSAERALEAGLYDLAFSLAVDAEALLGEDESVERVELLAIDASLAMENWVEATARLDSLSATGKVSDSEIFLRRAMVAYAEESVDGVDVALGHVLVERLSDASLPWHWFLRGWSAQRKNEGGYAGAFEEAHSGAIARSPALGAQLGYLIFKSKLAAQTVDAETVAQLQNAMLESEGREIGYAYAQQLAVSLFDSGNRDEAVELITAQLDAIPEELVLEHSQLLLLQSMAVGLGEVAGRLAFQELLLANRFPGPMGIALQRAFSEVRLDEAENLDFLRTVLDDLISFEGEHALLDQALYYRSVFKFQNGDFPEAEEDAMLFQNRFANSPYRRGMLALQASSAWNRDRFRTAASYLQQLKTEFPDLGDSSTLSALTADCYLRAGLRSNTVEDFQNAADAYAAALNSVEIAGQGGPILYQLVLSRIRSRRVDLALDALDDPYLRGLARGEMIWRSEWIVIKELRGLESMNEAYDRVELVLARTVSDPSLRLRLLWLAVKLSLESGQPEDTEYWTDKVDVFVAESGEGAFRDDLAAKVKASCLLTLADSSFALGETEDALMLLERLRDQYSGYESAPFSYITEARYYSSINRTVEAQQLLVSLVDEYSNHRLAPLALFEAALNAERRGEDAFLDQANKLLERVATEYPESELVYNARLKQADLLRKLNKFGAAARIYSVLENEYSDRPDRFLAQLSLADTLLAQSNEDPSKFAAAVSRLELLMDLPDAPLDMRVEAGYKLGQAWRVRGERLKAKQTYWLFYDLAIVEEPRIRTLTHKGRYWLSRCLFALAEISKEEGEVDRVNEFYQQIVEYRLQGAALAAARLESLQSGVEN